MHRSVRGRLASVLLLLAACSTLSLAAPTFALAGCNPRRSPGPAGASWQAGAYIHNFAPWGVHADIEGYEPYVPTIQAGAASLATVMLVGNFSSWQNWVQPGWVKHENVAGQPNGRHSFVQVWEHGGTQRNYYWSDLSSDPEQIPGIGEFGRYAALVSWIDPNYAYNVKLAGVGWWAFQMSWFPNGVEIFGEITNTAAQLPGDPSNREGFKTAQYQLSDLIWRDMAVNVTNDQPAHYHASQPASDWYTINDTDGDCAP